MGGLKISIFSSTSKVLFVDIEQTKRVLDVCRIAKQ